jgi:hypothetical protein
MNSNFYVREVSKTTCIDFIQNHHYSPVMPSLTKHYIGFFNENEMVGALTLGWGTQPLQTIRKLFPDLTSEAYYEIGKMCVHDKMPRNTESQFLSLVKRWMVDNTNKILLYTLADGIVGKVGYVYQASNFMYGGSFWTDVYIGPDGEKIHPRSAKALCEENAKFLGKKRVFWLTPDFNRTKGIRRIRGKMFRYMLPLYKNERKRLLNAKWSIDYPKENDLEWKEQVAKGKYSKLQGIPKFALDVVNVNYKNVNSHRSNHIGDF